MASRWRRTAKRKVITGMELLVADATVAEVYLRLRLCRFMLTVLLQHVRTRAIHVIHTHVCMIDLFELTARIKNDILPE
jgi:hypothetical protein